MSHPLGMRHCNVGMLYLPLGCASRVGLLERVTSSAAAAGFLGLRTFNRQSHRQIPRIFTHDIPAIRIHSASPNPQRLSGLDIFRGQMISAGWRFFLLENGAWKTPTTWKMFYFLNQKIKNNQKLLIHWSQHLPQGTMAGAEGRCWTGNWHSKFSSDPRNGH